MSGDPLGDLGTLAKVGTLGNLGSVGKVGILGRQSGCAKSAISTNPAISVSLAGHLGKIGCLGYVGRQSRPSMSVTISVLSAILVLSATQAGSLRRNLRLKKLAPSAVPAGNFPIWTCNLPFSAGDIANHGNLRRHSRQDGHHLHSQQSP